MKNLAKKLVVKKLNNKVKKLLESQEISIVAVTGSIGKTTTKLAIGQVLGATRKVLYTQDSYNTDIGIPLSIFGLKVPSQLWNVNAWQKIYRTIDEKIAKYEYDTIVIELADDELAMMKRVLSVIHPQVGVISAVAPVHMQRLGNMQTVVNDNWQIAAHAETIIYNADYEPLRKKAFKSDTIGFGLQYGNVQFKKVSRTKNGQLKAELKIGKHKKTIHTHMLGKQNLYSLLAAAAVADCLEMPFQAICFELSQIRPVVGRMNLLPAINDAQVIDDSYNASPDAVIAALETLDTYKGRKIAILGSMNELGDHALDAHQRVGVKAAKVADVLITIGASAERFMAPAAIHAGMQTEQIKMFRTPYEAGHYVKSILQKGDTVLVKGSQDGVYAEEATRIILSPSVNAKDVLVRQSNVWKRRKKKSFAL